LKINGISFGVFLILFVTAWILGSIRKDDAYYRSRTRNVEAVMAKKEKATMDVLRIVADRFYDNNDQSLFRQYNTKFGDLLLHQDISVYAYYNDSLVFWTSSYIPVPVYSFDEDFLLSVVKLKNGWYRLVKYRQDDLLLIGLILIKHEYVISNKYLVDHFQEEFHVEDPANIVTQKGVTPHEIKDRNGNYLFGLVYPDEAADGLRHERASGVLFMFAALSWFVFLFTLKYLPFFRRRQPAHFLFFVVSVILTRYLMLNHHFPRNLYRLDIFNPEFFASSRWLPSLGDFIIHAMLLTVCIALLTRQISRLKPDFSNRWVRNSLTFVFGVIAALCAWIVNYLVERLVFDSRISFDLANLLVLNIYSFIGFSLITLFLLSYLVVIYFFARVMSKSRQITFQRAAWMSFIPYFLIGLYIYLNGRPDAMLMIFPYLIYLAILSLNYRRKRQFNFYAFAPAILLFTLYSTYLLFRLNDRKEKDQRQILAFKIADEQDHVAEFLFIEAEEKLKKDQVVRQMLFDNEYLYPPEFFERIAKNYFSGYWSKYALVITAFSMEDYRYLGTPQADPDLQYYENSIEFNGQPTASPDLFFIDNNYGNVNYIAKVEMLRQLPLGEAKKIIFIEFRSKIVTQVAGFPELLLDDKITKPVDIGGYSYAVYKTQKLNVSGGDFIYPLNSMELSSSNEELFYTASREYSHLFYRTPSGKIVVVSKKALRWQEFLSPFAYLLIYFSFIMFLYFIYRYFFLNDNDSLQFNFKTRIQLSILSILLISLVVVGLGINSYVINQFNRKNKLTINEKTNSILTELKSALEENNYPVFDADYLEYLLRRLSNVFFTDINFYKSNGTLVGTSRESVYNEGLLSRQMDPVAFTELSENKQSSFVHIEKIGDFEYLSAYATFRNNSNEILGYVNLPYFLRQKELKEEQASSLLALINIYSLLIAISMIVTFIIANRLTEPLTLLQEKIGQIRLGRKNERIDYRKNDEIGGLVSEYNRMIRELEQSADLLARSERESAWREMAKQVAHEVKNPLTPMKLSVQYLLKAWEDKRPDFDERLRKFRDAMIEQIETLSAIASEFSYFAKMPTAMKLEMDLLELLNNCLEFYRNNESQVEIRMNDSGLRRAMILADKDQMLRLFNNLIRNAIQAIPEDRKGRVEFTVTRNDNYYEIRVKDNGVGIPEEIRDKIFAPNFTTKNSGMGLGLAMSKTIVENMNGDISYETTPGEGTMFIIRVPVLGSKNMEMADQ